MCRTTFLIFLFYYSWSNYSIKSNTSCTSKPTPGAPQVKEQLELCISLCDVLLQQRAGPTHRARVHETSDRQDARSYMQQRTRAIKPDASDSLRVIRWRCVRVGVPQLTGQSLIVLWTFAVTGPSHRDQHIRCRVSLSPLITVFAHNKDPGVCGMITRCDTMEGAVNRMWAKYNVLKGPSSAWSPDERTE